MEGYQKTCCVTGHRPSGFPWNYRDTECARHQEYLESMACHIDYYIRKHNVKHFICGGAIGVDTDFAEIVLGLRDNSYDDIKLEIAVPCRDQDKKWTDADKLVYNQILNNADTITFVSETYSPSCMLKRNKYMVDKSNIVFAFWNRNKNSGGTYNTIEYAKKLNKDLKLFILNNY